MARKAGRKASSKRGKTQAGLLERYRSMLRGFLFGGPVEEESADRFQEIKGLVFIGLAAWLFLSLVTFWDPPSDPLADGRNLGGSLGHFFASGALRGFGWGSYLVVLLLAAWGLVILTRKTVAWPALRLFGGVCFVFSVGFLLQLGLGPETVFADGETLYLARSEVGALSPTLPGGPGGWSALMLEPALVEKFGRAGLWILLSITAVVSFMLATEMAFYPAIAAFNDWREERAEDSEESLLSAIGRWTGALFVGLWDFLRGADLEDEPATATKAKSKSKPKAKSKAKAKSTPKKAAAKSKSKKAADEDEVPLQAATRVEAEDALEDDEEWEYEDDPDAEEEWEYEDEEYEDDDEAELEDPDDDEEWEYEEVDEEEWEYEDEEEEDPEREAAEIIPAAKPKKTPAKPKKDAAQPKKDVVKPMQAKALNYESPTPPAGPWTFPSLELLIDPEGAAGVDNEHLQKSAVKLESALKSFRVDAEVKSAQVGPAVTMFELTVAEGTRMNKVTALSQEIAAALQARSVRVIAPIPGRSTIGVEVPNKSRRVVRLRELIHKKAYDKKFMALPLFLGMDAEGTPIVEDLAKMPHLLIAGQTGSGKSVCINTILASVLLTRSPHDCQMILVDPKMVELQMFSKVPHLMCPVVTDARHATQVLNWAVEKMEGRYELMKDAGVRNIKGYNALGEEALRERLGDNFNEERTPRHLPYIVIVIDEMADLMMVSKKEAEQAITRLAQKSRAVGLHVIVATQRPSTDVITGVLKGNLPTRIAFSVASKIDSRVILDTMGAEKLLGNGDMLYTPPASSSINRVQGALVEDDELQRVIDFVCESSAPTFNQELVQTATGSKPPGEVTAAAGSGPDDPMWDQAVRTVLKTKRGSASLLQRALGVGYTRASRLIDQMTEEGILGDHRGSKSRELMMTLEDWEEMHGTPIEQGAGDE